MDPIPLIFEDFSVNQNAIKIFENETRPVIIITVVGPYRSGKSYLLNRIMGKSDGFPLGATVQAKTKGIWMWAGDFFGDPSKAIVLLDTEGLDDPEKGSASHDVNLFALAILLSSVFIYNTKGTIDARSLDGLHLATEISKFIFTNQRDKSLAESEGLGQHFPLFLWAVRDHHLKLEIKGKEVTSDEYLEFCLQRKAGNSIEVVKYNILRDALKDFFPNRSCIVFPAPAHGEKMNILDQIPEEDLSKEFRDAGKKFLTFLSENAITKKIKTTQITGATFGLLVNSLVESVLKKNICIESTHKYVTEKANQNACERAIQGIVDFFNDLKEQFPLSQENFEIFGRDVYLAACEKFLDFAINVDKTSEVFQEFRTLAVETIKKFETKNNEISNTKCHIVLMNLFEQTEMKEKQGEFMEPGGYLSLKEELDLVLARYLSEKDNEEEMGPEFETVLQKFEIQKFKPLLERTLFADEMLTEKERKLWESEMEKTEQENIARRTQENFERAQNQLHESNRAHEESLRLLESRLKKSHVSQMEELQLQIERKRIEMERNHLTANLEMRRRNEEELNRLRLQMGQIGNREIVVVQRRDPCVIS